MDLGKHCGQPVGTCLEAGGIEDELLHHELTHVCPQSPRAMRCCGVTSMGHPAQKVSLLRSFGFHLTIPGSWAGGEASREVDSRTAQGPCLRGITGLYRKGQ